MTSQVFSKDHQTASKLIAIGLLGIAFASLAGCAAEATKEVTGAAPAVAAAYDSERPAKREATDESAADSPSEFNTEAYDHVVENNFLPTLQNPQSTFSVDVDTASYSNVRRLLSDGTLPPAGAVRIEELVNYFQYSYDAPEDNRPFSVQTELANCPWDTSHHLLKIGLHGSPIDFRERAPSNLVFLLDVSGSMMRANKLPLVKSAMRLLTEELNPADRIAIVVYAGASGLVLDSTEVRHSSQILDAVEQLSAGGSTNGAAGIQLAYQIAEENFVTDGINRVILCTDGDFNVGTTNQSELVKLIQQKAASNVFLTVLGFGSGNLKDSTMEKLADEGNGNYAYIDSMLEARKVLVEQIGATLVTIAKDVKIQIDFNPQHVQAYRLLGYENRLMKNEDFRDDSKDAGEIGAGHSVTAFYELVPAGATPPESDQRDSEFVQPSLKDTGDPGTQLTVNLRYKLPKESNSSEFQVRVPAQTSFDDPSQDFKFASAVAAYGMLLRESKFSGSANWDWVIDTATENLGEDPRGLRAEFIQLAKTARRLSN